MKSALSAASLILCFAASAGAQPADAPASAAGAPKEEKSKDESVKDEKPKEPPANASDVERRLSELEAQNKKLRQDLDDLRDAHEETSKKVQDLLPLSGKISGYLDFGAFWVGGDGSGIRTDAGHVHYPQYAGVPDTWTFLGDPLSTAINSRGDPADTGPSRAVTFNPIKSNGKASFIVNALNLGLFAAIGESVTLNGMIDFVPRGRDVSNPNGLFLGDFVDIKLAYVEWLVPIEAFKLSLYAGKVDSVLGYEYRGQEAPDRLTVTPSLICRYTCGRPVGFKARGQFFRDVVTLAVAVTNGSSMTEGFPFYDETDSNNFKTVSGRLSSKAPIGAGLEVGVSASFGAQDRQPADDVYHWHYGVDLHFEIRDFEITGEFVQGRAVGKSEPPGTKDSDGNPVPPCSIAPCLDYKGGYGQVGYRVFNWLEPYVRVDGRDALHQNGGNFTYVSKLVRVTGGLRSEIGTSVVLKAEYTHDHELGAIPQFPNDVATSSLVVKY